MNDYRSSSGTTTFALVDQWPSKVTCCTAARSASTSQPSDVAMTNNILMKIDLVDFFGRDDKFIFGFFL
jgi:hypothetical protein